MKWVAELIGSIVRRTQTLCVKVFGWDSGPYPGS
jgi:hypothetical protein